MELGILVNLLELSGRFRCKRLERYGVMQKESDALAASLFKVRNFPDPSIKFPVRSKEFPVRPPKIPCFFA
jgi:hypothetical protein